MRRSVKAIVLASAVARGELEAKRRLRSEFARACRAVRQVDGNLELRAMCALAYIGSAAGYKWDDIKLMLEGK